MPLVEIRQEVHARHVVYNKVFHGPKQRAPFQRQPAVCDMLSGLACRKPCLSCFTG